MSRRDGRKDLIDGLLFDGQCFFDQLQLLAQLVALALHPELFAAYNLSGLDELVNGVEFSEKGMANRTKKWVCVCG